MKVHTVVCGEESGEKQDCMSISTSLGKIAPALVAS
jgi:hypothetical protein